jgi:hypothetical protein
MDSSFNYRHTQIHRADLAHRAELHRLAAQAHKTKQEEQSARASLLAPPSFLDMVHATFARLRHHAARPNPN